MQLQACGGRGEAQEDGRYGERVDRVGPEPADRGKCCRVPYSGAPAPRAVVGVGGCGLWSVERAPVAGCGDGWRRRQDGGLEPRTSTRRPWRIPPKLSNWDVLADAVEVASDFGSGFVFFVLDACSSDQNLRARKSIRVWVKVRAEAAAIRANRRMHDRQVLAFPRGDKAAGQSVNQVSGRVACRIGPQNGCAVEVRPPS